MKSLYALAAVMSAASIGCACLAPEAASNLSMASLTGPHAAALAAPLLISGGFAAWSGRLTWGIAGSVIFGIVLVFGSAQIVQFFQSAVGGTSSSGTGGTLTPVQSTLTTLVSALTGPIATALATLAVIACGFFAWSGRLTARLS